MGWEDVVEGGGFGDAGFEDEDFNGGGIQCGDITPDEDTKRYL
jgi:hypothetical protein